MVLVVGLGFLVVVWCCVGFFFFWEDVCFVWVWVFFLHLLLKKVSSCCCKMTSISYTLSLHQKLQKAQQVSLPVHLLPTADTVLNSAHFWWLGMEEGFP